MKNIGCVFFTFAIFICLSPDARAAVVCHGKVAAPKVSVKLEQSRVLYDNSLTSSQMDDMSRQSGGSTLEGYQTIGLTSYSLGFETQLRFVASPASNGQICIFVTHANVTVFNGHFDVFVDRRYRRGTCQYNQILRHEEGHVRFVRDFMRDYRTGVRKALTPILQRLSPMLGSSASQKRIIMDRLQTALEPVRASYEAKLDQLNGALDTPESYQRTAEQCPDW